MARYFKDVEKAKPTHLSDVFALRQFMWLLTHKQQETVDAWVRRLSREKVAMKAVCNGKTDDDDCDHGGAVVAAQSSKDFVPVKSMAVDGTPKKADPMNDKKQALLSVLFGAAR